MLASSFVILHHGLFCSHLSGDNSRMTDVDREQIDKEAQNIIQRCRDNLNNVKRTGDFMQRNRF